MRSLHPAWYNHKPGEEITDHSLADSLAQHFHEIDTIGELMTKVDQPLSERTFTRIGWMLINKAEEAKSLVDQWIKKHSNVTRLTTDGDQS